jgi:hypothetical protein
MNMDLAALRPTYDRSIGRAPAFYHGLQFTLFVVVLGALLLGMSQWVRDESLQALLVRERPAVITIGLSMLVGVAISLTNSRRVSSATFRYRSGEQAFTIADGGWDSPRWFTEFVADLERAIRESAGTAGGEAEFSGRVR